jgi:hypothetical protein
MRRHRMPHRCLGIVAAQDSPLLHRWVCRRSSLHRNLSALVDCHVNHVVHRQHHQMRRRRGQLLPRMLCGSTVCLYAHGEAPMPRPSLLANSLLPLPSRHCILAAQRCLLQTPLGVQEVTPSTQLLSRYCSLLRLLRSAK